MRMHSHINTMGGAVSMIDIYSSGKGNLVTVTMDNYMRTDSSRIVFLMMSMVIKCVH